MYNTEYDARIRTDTLYIFANLVLSFFPDHLETVAGKGKLRPAGQRSSYRRLTSSSMRIQMGGSLERAQAVRFAHGRHNRTRLAIFISAFIVRFHQSLSRSPSSALLPLFLGRVPLLSTLIHYCNLPTGGRRPELVAMGSSLGETWPPSQKLLWWNCAWVGQGFGIGTSEAVNGLILTLWMAHWTRFLKGSRGATGVGQQTSSGSSCFGMLESRRKWTLISH